MRQRDITQHLCFIHTPSGCLHYTTLVSPMRLCIGSACEAGLSTGTVREGARATHAPS